VRFYTTKPKVFESGNQRGKFSQKVDFRKENTQHKIIPMTTENEQKIKRTRLEIALERSNKANALVQKLQAQAAAQASGQKRALDNRRKILLGAYLLDKIEHDPGAKSAVLTGLDRFLTRPAERALFDLAPLTDSTSSPQEKQP
jgi:large subunit ribosomal protein L7/L12